MITVQVSQKSAILGVVAVAGILAKTAKGIVSFVQNLLPIQTQKEGVRPVHIGMIYGLLFAELLFALLLPHLAAQSSGTPTRTTSTAQLQDGAQVQWIWMLPIAGGIGVRIAWRKWLLGTGGALAVGVGSNAIWNAATKTWTLPPGAARKGRVTARARIGLWKVDGEETQWYGMSGEWAGQLQWGFNHNDPDDDLNTDSDVRFPSSDNQKRDYHYFDYHTTWMYWDADNEIWKSNGETQRHYGDTNYYPASSMTRTTKENQAPITPTMRITTRAKRGI